VLEEVEGNVTEAAERLGVHSARLRALVAEEPALRRTREEALERGVDRAIAVLFEGMRAEHYGVKLSASKEFLRSEAARRRGFGVGGAALEVTSRPGERLTITWLDPNEPEPPDPKLIEGEKADQ
jgi:hypothetical protein